MTIKPQDMRDFMGLRPSQITEIARQIGAPPRMGVVESDLAYAQRVLVDAARLGQVQALVERTAVCLAINRADG